jgi:RNA polymerase sigma factor (sigma-70 family)
VTTCVSAQREEIKVFAFENLSSLERLLRAISAGDERAQQGLYERFKPLFHNAVKHRLRLKGCANPDEDTFEVANAVWGKTFQYLGKLRNYDSFVCWAHQIMESEVNAHLARCIRWQAEIPLEGFENEPARIASAEEIVSNAERVEKILVLAETIDSRLPAIIMLRHSEELSFAEIANRIGESPGNVRTIYSRGIKKLPPILKDESALMGLGI